MPISARILAAPRFVESDYALPSWRYSERIHVETPRYSSFHESEFTASTVDASNHCACPACGGASPSSPEYFMPPQSGVAGNGLPIYDWDQAAAQLARQSNGWGAGATVTFGFRANAPTTMPNGVGGFVPFTATQIAMTIESLALWSEVADITFLLVANGEGYTDNATMLFGNYTSGAGDASAFAYYPGGSANAGDVWINYSLDTNNSNLVEGAFGPHTMAHEIGHAIGIAHPANYDASDSTDPAYPGSSVYWQDSRMYSVMSYFGSAGPGGNLAAFASGPQLHDIAAAQLLYGANLTTRTGDTVYGFNSNTGHDHFTIYADEATPVFAIWDAGGNDTLDLSGYSTAVEIDLREEAFSSAGPGAATNTINNGRAYGNISIARGVTIENAVGGNGADTLIGNTVANRLTGNGANDSIDGGLGVDASVYAIASTSATWTRNVNGTWTITGQGTDTTTSVEFLDFTDRDVFLDRAFQTFSGNGTSDVLFRRTDGIMASWEVTGTAINSASFLPTAGAEWTPLGTGDISGDGRDDVIWQRNDGLVYAWLMNGGVIASAVALTGLGAGWTFLGTGDFNGDLTDDFAWQRNDGLVYTWTMNNSAIQSANAITGLGAEWAFQGAGDFNGDGRDDFLWRRTDTGQTVIWQMNGPSIEASGATSTQIGLDWSVVGIGDANGDGRDDIIMQRSSDGLLSLWAMNGLSVLSTTNIGAASPAEWAVQNIGDYNGDGRDDILWQRNDGLVYAWLLNGASLIGAGGLSGVGPEWTIVGGG